MTMTDHRKRRRRTVRDEERAEHPDTHSARGPEDRVEAGGEGPVEVPIERPDETPAADEPTVDDARRADEAQARVAELEDKLKRNLADFRNETQRIARQAEEGRKFAVEGLVKELLPVFDALHSARQGLVAAREEPSSSNVDAVRQGLDLVEKELLKVLGRHGVQRIEAAATPFDPGLHEALFVVDHPELEPGTVAQELRPGFTLHGRVVRAAHVAVTRPAPPAEERPGADESEPSED